ncbi:MAG: LysE family translocator, partial [Cocleimonas sp.]
MIIFALIGAISPGPVNIIATGAGANFGFKRTLPFVMGATFSYTLVVFLVGIGLNTILEKYPQITHSLQYIGGAFLLYMSYKIAMAKPTNNMSQNLLNNTTTLQLPPSFIHGFLTQSLNPKAWLVSMSGVSLFVSANSPASYYLLIFCIISFGICFIGVATWAIIGQLISQFLSTEKRQRLFNIFMGLLLSSTVLFIV